MNQNRAALKDSYRLYVRRKWFVLFTLVAILFACVVASISVGSSGLTISEIVTALIGRGTRQTNAIVWNIRMPRIVTGIMVGFALALAGCIMQNVLRNPLASSSTLGVSQGASFGAAFAIVCLDAGAQVNASTSAAAAVSITNPYLVTLCAFIGGFLTTVVILGLSRVAKVSPSTMVLAGVALSSLFSGGTTIVQYFADDVKVASVVYWTFGDLGRANWREITLIFAITAVSLVYFLGNRWNFNAMEGGVDTAKSLGVPVDRLIFISMTLCSLMAAHQFYWLDFSPHGEEICGQRLSLSHSCIRAGGSHCSGPFRVNFPRDCRAQYPAHRCSYLFPGCTYVPLDDLQKEGC